MLKGTTPGIDASTLKANVATRPLARTDTGALCGAAFRRWVWKRISTVQTRWAEVVAPSASRRAAHPLAA